MKCEIVDRDIDKIKEIDDIRVKAFNLEYGGDYYLNNLSSGKMIAIKAIIDEKPIGGCYVYISPNTYSLNIDRIFMLEEYRHNNYASELLEYVLNNKSYFEDYYNLKVDRSIVEPSNDDLIKFYRENGYSGPGIIGNMTRILEYEKNNNKIR